MSKRVARYISPEATQPSGTDPPRRRAWLRALTCACLGGIASAQVLAQEYRINDVTVTEGQTATFTVTRSGENNQLRRSTSVRFATQNGTAVSGQDYTSRSGTLNFDRNVTTATISVTTLNNSTPEPTETFNVNLSNPSRGSIRDGLGVGTILDDDAVVQPSITIGDVTVTEGQTANFTVSLSAASTQTVTVVASTANGSAVAPGDFTARSNVTITFPAGSTSQTFAVTTVNDTLVEQTETFTVNLIGATNATIGDAQGVGTILDNDVAPPSISISDVTVDEGQTANFTIGLSAASTQTVTVVASTANGTATAGSDYTARTNVTVTFPAGSTSQTFSVQTINDTAVEAASETFNVNLTNPSNATIADGQGVGTILDNDTAPQATLSINDVTVTEGQTANFTVTRSGTTTTAVSVQASTVNGTATAPGDFTARTNVTLSFAAGVTTQTFAVTTINDTVAEPTETFTVVLSNATNATIADNTGVGTINDNDPPAQPSIRINDVGVTEGGTANFTISLSATSTQTVTVVASTANGTATAPGDFTARTNVTVTFAAGTTTQTFAVTTINDTLAEPTETFNVNLTNPVNATIADAQGVGTINDNDALPPVPNVSINSTSTNSVGPNRTVVPEVGQVANSTYSVLAINDLGMHCGDLDTRISSILPPFQVLLAQVVQKGATPVVNPAGISVAYSSVANPNDPILGQGASFTGVMADGSTYKTNFWDGIAKGTYDPFYPGGLGITPLDIGGFPVTEDVGLPVPNVEDLYIGPDGVVDRPGVSSDGFLSAVQHAMPGIASPYLNTPAGNAPQTAQEHYLDKPFFVNFPFGYVAADVNWFEGAGVPFAAFDDFGRENAYPLVRVQARNAAGTVLSTVDTVLPISGEASCTNCHTTNADYVSVHGVNNRTDIPTNAIATALGPNAVAESVDDPDPNMPPKVSLEYAADINVLRLHDIKHGASYVAPAPANNGTTVPAPCTINAANPDGNVNCLINKALVQDKPVVCQVCHYTPALDLAHVGPMTGPVRDNQNRETTANGRNQLSHKSNSNVMHDHHGSITALDRNGVAMFPAIPVPTQNNTGVTNQAVRLDALENSCYQCHPGTSVQCLRGAMFNGDMLCSDCHGSMLQVGNDFSRNVSPTNPGAFILAPDFYTNANTPRTPWANEPGCGSCHTGDNTSRLTGTGLVVNTVDNQGNTDGIRLRQAFRTGDAKATPIVPTNKRFAEPVVPATFGNFNNPGAGNPQLYRVSTGHGGVMCEGCHGATHAEWPNANPNGNDNQTALQLQGHVGVIGECSTCHGTAMDTNTTLNGPHGLHSIGGNASTSPPFASSSRHRVLGSNFANCSTCHGGTSRGNSPGTVLSRTLAPRRINGQTVPAGTPIGCNRCH